MFDRHHVTCCLLLCLHVAKLVETGTFAGDEDDDVLFDDMVDDYEDEDEAIDAVSSRNYGATRFIKRPLRL